MKEVKEFYSNHRLKRKYFVDEKDFKQGKSIEYYQDGSIMYETHFKDNIEHGFTVFFNKDGSLKYMGHHIEGKKDGIWSYSDVEKYYIKGKECEKEDLKIYLIKTRFNTDN